MVDDHYILLTALKVLLDGQDDIKVTGMATDALSAVKLIKAKTPDVVLLDISLHDINGLGLIPKFKTISPESRILILTMHEDKQYLKRAIDSGASGFLIKKAMDYDLIYAIRTVARGEIYIHPSMIEGFMSGPQSKTDAGISREKLLWNSLSSREQEVVIGIVQGFTNKEIAEKRFLSEKTVATYRLRGMEKLGLEKKSDLVDFIEKLKILKQ
jgi:DNA-binding NarL/FixJ family response regulator